MKKQSQFGKGQMDVTVFTGEAYGSIPPSEGRRNKANQSQCGLGVRRPELDFLDSRLRGNDRAADGSTGARLIAQLKKQSQFGEGQMNVNVIGTKDYASR